MNVICTSFSSPISRHSGEVIHVLNLDIREIVHELDSKIREILYKLPFADLVGEIG